MFLRTDILIRTSFPSDIINKIHQIRQDAKIKSPLEDEQIQDLLEEPLNKLTKTDTETSYVYDGKLVNMNNYLYAELMKKRIAEYKRDDIAKQKSQLVERLINKLPREMDERELDKIDLSTFLKCVEVSLNTHPLYRFYAFQKTPIQGQDDKFYITLKAPKGIIKRVGSLLFSFVDKLKRVLQGSVPTFDPMVGLRNVWLHKEIKLDYSSSIMAFVECSVITHSLMGTTL